MENGGIGTAVLAVFGVENAAKGAGVVVVVVIPIIVCAEGNGSVDTLGKAEPGVKAKAPLGTADEALGAANPVSTGDEAPADANPNPA